MEYEKTRTFSIQQSVTPGRQKHRCRCIPDSSRGEKTKNVMEKWVKFHEVIVSIFSILRGRRYRPYQRHFLRSRRNPLWSWPTRVSTTVTFLKFKYQFLAGEFSFSEMFEEKESVVDSHLAVKGVEKFELLGHFSGVKRGDYVSGGCVHLQPNVLEFLSTFSNFKYSFLAGEFFLSTLKYPKIVQKIQRNFLEDSLWARQPWNRNFRRGNRCC